MGPRGGPTGGVIVFRGGGSGPHSSEHETKLFNVCNDVESVAGIPFPKRKIYNSCNRPCEISLSSPFSFFSFFSDVRALFSR
jgi:hypothetical protein